MGRPRADPRACLRVCNMCLPALQENMDLAALLPLPDEEVVGVIFNSFDFSLDHCLPCVLYLCIKYHDSPAKAMTASANLGGDAAHRTALIGILMGDHPAPDPLSWTQRTSFSEMFFPFAGGQSKLTEHFPLLYRPIPPTPPLLPICAGATHGYTEIPLEWRVGLKDHESLGAVFEHLVLQGMQMKL